MIISPLNASSTTNNGHLNINNTINNSNVNISSNGSSIMSNNSSGITNQNDYMMNTPFRHSRLSATPHSDMSLIDDYDRSRIYIYIYNTLY